MKEAFEHANTKNDWKDKWIKQLESAPAYQNLILISETNSSLQSEITALKEQLAEARGVIEFYGNQSNWGGYHRHVDTMMAEDSESAKYKSDDFDIMLAGKRARAYLQRYPVSDGGVR